MNLQISEIPVPQIIVLVIFIIPSLLITILALRYLDRILCGCSVHNPDSSQSLDIQIILIIQYNINNNNLQYLGHYPNIQIVLITDSILSSNIAYYNPQHLGISISFKAVKKTLLFYLAVLTSEVIQENLMLMLKLYEHPVQSISIRSINSGEIYLLFSIVVLCHLFIVM